MYVCMYVGVNVAGLRLLKREIQSDKNAYVLEEPAASSSSSSSTRGGVEGKKKRKK